MDAPPHDGVEELKRLAGCPLRGDIWGGPIMLLFLCDYAIFYAPIMPLYAHIYAPNYADYAQIMQIMLKLCQLCQNMQFMLNYAIMLNYARRLARGGGAASGPPSSRQVAPPVWPNTLRPKKTHTHTHTHTEMHS